LDVIETPNGKYEDLYDSSMIRSRHLSIDVPKSNLKIEQGKIRRRSHGDILSTTWQPSQTNISTQQPSQAATQVLIGAGYSRNIALIQEKGSSNTTLQIAMLNLVEDLNNASKTTNGAEEKVTKLSSIEPIKEEFTRGNGELVNKGEITKISVVEPLLGSQSKKKISFNLSDYEGMQEKFADTPWYFSSSALFIFSIDNKLRKVMALLVESIWYERFMMCCCILSVVVSIRMDTVGKVLPARLGSFDFFLFAVFNYPLPTSFINLLELNVT
jgi:hypothetical protein